MLKSDQVQLVKELSKTQYKIFAKKIELVELEERLLKGEDVTVDDLEPSWGYKLEGLIFDNILVRRDSRVGGIMLSRVDNTDMSKDDKSWFRLRGYDENDNLIYTKEFRSTYLSNQKLITIPFETSYILLSFKRDENKSEGTNAYNVLMFFANGEWEADQYD
jgi:hypothetical protein